MTVNITGTNYNNNQITQEDKSLSGENPNKSLCGGNPYI